jgi:hypothetical protein
VKHCALVVIESELYGTSFAIAREVSADGALVEMSYAPPIGTELTVHITHVYMTDEGLAADELAARAEVCGHGFRYPERTRVVGLRFSAFLEESCSAAIH